jgi:hypothetical protein
MKKVLILVAVTIGVLAVTHKLSQITVQGQALASITAGVGTPTLDGIADQGEWTSEAIMTSRGVTIQAMMDEMNFYVMATWPDSAPSVNQNHWTWDGQQWNASEDEDRIAFIWEIVDAQGNPLNGENGPSCTAMCHPGEGMGTAVGRVDVWHAKSTRFLPVGFTDDKYWDTDAPDGRHSDSGSGSGDRNRNDAQTGPTHGPFNVTFLAEDQAALDAINANGAGLGSAAVKILLDGTETIEVNDTSPGRILAVPTGNRASVKTVGGWSDGVWTMEFSRKLAGEVDGEGNPQDFAVIPGGSVRFTTDIFDNLGDHASHSFAPAGNSSAADFTVYTLNFPDPTTLYFAQTGNGAGFTADHVFTNPSADQIVSATMDFFDENGDPLPIDIVAVEQARYQLSRSFAPEAMASSVEFEVDPQGVFTISSSGVGEAAVDGAAVVSADYTLGGVVRFKIPGIGIAGVGETGIALHHAKSGEMTAAQTITMNLSLRNEQGGEEATRTIEGFPDRGHLADFVTELFSDFFAQNDTFTGTLVVTVEGGKVAATALELGGNPGEFTTLPVTPIP